MDIRDICVSKEISVIKAIEKLDCTNRKILLVIEEAMLIGTLTDGDIRRWILKNGDLNKSISLIMNSNPVYLFEEEVQRADIEMRKNYIEAIPIVDRQKRIKDIIFWNDKFIDKLNYYEDEFDLPVVIMAGGKGSRLYPYTKVLPKPLIPIGEIPIVERIINSFTEYGCSNFYLTLNYKKSLIKAYFEDIDMDYKVSYIEEERFLGTGGSLFLLKDKINSTFFVSNCDILLDINYSDVIKYHKANGNKITMVTSLKNYEIPYGVIKTDDDGNILEMEEKPKLNLQVNTGVYVLEPEVLQDIPKDEFFHITDLIDRYIDKGEKIGSYPVTEKAWLDMGEMSEMNNMLKQLGIKCT